MSHKLGSVEKNGSLYLRFTIRYALNILTNESSHEKTCLRVSDKDHKRARGWNFRIKEVEEFYYLCKEIKTKALISSVPLFLHSIMQKAGFS